MTSCQDCTKGLFVAGHLNVNCPGSLVIGHLANIGHILNNLHLNSYKVFESYTADMWAKYQTREGNDDLSR